MAIGPQKGNEAVATAFSSGWGYALRLKSRFQGDARGKIGNEADKVFSHNPTKDGAALVVEMGVVHGVGAIVGFHGADRHATVAAELFASLDATGVKVEERDLFFFGNFFDLRNIRIQVGFYFCRV